jgi:outer membrane protein TolC
MNKCLTLLLLSLTIISINALTLEESIDLALENNLLLRSTAEDVIVANEYYREVKSAILPQLSLSGGFLIKGSELPLSYIPPARDITGDLSGDATADEKHLADVLEKTVNAQIPSPKSEESNYIAQLKFDQVLYLGGKLTAGIKAAGIYKKLESSKYELEKQNTIFQTTDAFYQGLLAKEALDINRQAFELAEQHFLRVKTMYDQGIVSEFDLIRAELELSKLKPQVQQAENSYLLWEESFRQQLNLKSDQDIKLDGSIAYKDSETPILDSALDTAKENRVELFLARSNTEMREINLRAQRGSFLPNVSLSAEYSGLSKRGEHSIKPNDFITSYQVMIGFQIPIFKGFGNQAKTAQAKHEYYKATYDYKNLEDKIELDVRNNYQKLLFTKENYQAQKKRIGLAEKGVKIATARYESQVGINLEVLDAQLEYKMARLAYLQSIYELTIAEISLHKAMGLPLN